MFYLKRIIQILLYVIFFLSATIQADDSDIYFSGDVVRPNIMFVLDASGSMSSPVPGDLRGRDRLQVLQDSLDDVLSSASPLLNVGMMSFSGHDTKDYVNGPTFPVSPIDDPAEPIVQSNLLPSSLRVSGYEYQGMFSVAEDNIPDPASSTQTVRDFLKEVTRDLDHQRYTPIADSLYESARYYRGEELDWGKQVVKPDGDRSDRRAAHPSTYSGQYYQRRTVAPGACSTQTCIDNGGSGCPATKTNCRVVTTPCYNAGCGTNCQHHIGTYQENYCTAYHYDREAGDSCISYGTRTRHYDYWQCDEAITQCDYPYCSNSYGSWEARGRVPKYNSPIAETCQKSFTVLLSDGAPDVRGRSATEKAAAEDKIKTMVGTGSCKTVAQHFSEDPELASYPTNAQLEDGVCGAELTEFLATSDQIADTTLADKQTIATYTIGFGLTPHSSAEGYLKLLAKKGGGEYFSAGDEGSLVTAFNDILDAIGSTSSSFSSPVYSVNNATMFSHTDAVYMPLFDVGNFVRGAGNLKKFKIDSNGQLVGKGSGPTLFGVPNIVSAFDEQGRFETGVSDFWSNTANDSKDVTKGGVANLLDPSVRKLYSNLTGDNNVSLNDAANRITVGNINSSHLLEPTHPNFGDNSYKDKLVKFIQGYESDGTTARHHMGDIMHSKPELVSYNNSDTAEQIIFVGTNEGYLHAFDATTGQEKFAFMPKELLKNIDKQFQNTEQRAHAYGLDGEITVWRHDENNDGKIRAADNDFVRLFFGMRRGGRNIYALDVTDIANPKLLWKIKGGVGDFSELGQTWSKPTLTKLHSTDPADNGKLINVLVFGAGYDPALDEENVATRVADSMGRGVYIVNAETGQKIWSWTAGGSATIYHSVPSNIRTLDLDKDGSIDRLYFGDTGGNLWRADLDIDIRDGNTDTPTPSLYDINKAKVTKFAELGGTGADLRKFFNEPDVSLVKQKGRNVLLINIGSGYRSRPLNTTIQDRFYTLLDDNVRDLPSTPLTVIDGTLVDVTTLPTGKTIVTKKSEEEALGHTVNGWFYELPNTGEKVLASSLTFLGKVIFTTFSSTGATGDPCSTPPSSGRAYVLNVLTGQAALDLNRDNTIDRTGDTDKSIIAGTNEILGVPQLVFHEPKAVNGDPCSATDCHQYVDIRVGKKLTPIGDKNNSDDATPISSLNIGEILVRSFWLDQNATR